MVKSRGAVPTLVNIRVELFGLARIVSGRRLVEIALPETTSPAGIATALAEACPELLGTAILPDGSGLQTSYTFNLNGMAFLSDARLRLKPGDTILLFSSQAGG